MSDEVKTIAQKESRADSLIYWFNSWQSKLMDALIALVDAENIKKTNPEYSEFNVATGKRRSILEKIQYLQQEVAKCQKFVLLFGEYLEKEQRGELESLIQSIVDEANKPPSPIITPQNHGNRS